MLHRERPPPNLAIRDSVAGGAASSGTIDKLTRASSGGCAHPAKMASASTLRSTNRYIRSLKGLSGMATSDPPTPRLPNLLRLGEHVLRRFGYPNFRGVRPSPFPSSFAANHHPRVHARMLMPNGA